MSLKDELIRKAEAQLDTWEKEADALEAEAEAKESEAENQKASADIQQSCVRYRIKSQTVGKSSMRSNRAARIMLSRFAGSWQIWLGPRASVSPLLRTRFVA